MRLTLWKRVRASQPGGTLPQSELAESERSDAAIREARTAYRELSTHSQTLQRELAVLRPMLDVYRAALSLDRDQALTQIARVTASAVGASNGALWLMGLDGDRSSVIVADSTGVRRTWLPFAAEDNNGMELGCIGRAILETHIADALTAHLPSERQHVVLLQQRGTPIGMLALNYVTPGEPSEDRRALIEALTEPVAFAVRCAIGNKVSRADVA